MLHKRCRPAGLRPADDLDGSSPKEGRGEGGWGVEGKPETNRLMPYCQERAGDTRYRREFVPQSDTGRQAEYAKAREITLVKELGKMAP